MASWKRFEEMEVWKKGCRLACDVYEVSRDGELGKDFALRDQMRRAAVSIPSNIAEGFELRTDKDFVRMLTIAKGSCGELRTQMYIANRIGVMKADKRVALVKQAEEISKMLGGLIKKLKVNNTPNSKVQTRKSTATEEEARGTRT